MAEESTTEVTENDEILKNLFKTREKTKLFARYPSLRTTIHPSKYFPTGDETMDRMLGGGLKRGTITELFGKHGSGKTTLAALWMRLHLKSGGWGMWSDAEGAFDVEYFGRMGLCGEGLLAFRPANLEEQFGAIHDSMAMRGGGFYVIDSLASSLPTSEQDAMGTVVIGKHALVIAQNLKRLASLAAQSGSFLLVLNQMRQNISIPTPGQPMRRGGPSEKTPGGDSLKYYSSVRIRLRKVHQYKPKEMQNGRTQPQLSELTVVKNKGRGFENVQAEFLIIPGYGFKYAQGYKELEFGGKKKKDED